MKPSFLRLAVIAAGIASTTLALAHSGATGIVRERMDLMGRVGDANDDLTQIIRGRTEYDSQRVRDLALVIADHGGEAMTSLFPEGSLQAPSQAIPDIWSDWDRFSALADELTLVATALAASADNTQDTADTPAGGMMGTAPAAELMGTSPAAAMMSGSAGTSAGSENLADMPPRMLFLRLAQTCSACHRDFRKSGE